MRPTLLCFVLLMWGGSAASLSGQSAVRELLLIDEPVFRVLDRIGEYAGVMVYYDPEDIPYGLTSVGGRRSTLPELFGQAIAGTVLRVIRYDSTIYIAGPERLLSREYANRIVAAWRDGEMRSPDVRVAETQVLTFGSGSTGKAEVQVRGRILDASSGEALAGATIFEASTGRGTATTPDGTFALTLPPGEHLLALGLLGYLDQPLRLVVLGTGDPLTLQMTPTTVGMADVVVSANSAAAQQRDGARGLTILSTRALQNLPTLGGDLNILIALSSQPGVASSSEGSAAITVRGGGLDQNLVLQAGLPLLYPAHALGFFPVFHPDLVAGVRLYKGYVPAEFGERAASVLEVDWRNGDLERWRLRGSVGAFASRLAVEGPLVKRRVSLLVGARRSHLNYALKGVRNGNVTRSRVEFADVSARLHGAWRGGGAEVNAAYTSDYFLYSASFGYDYRNLQFGGAFRQNLRPGLLLNIRAGQTALAVDEFELRVIPGAFTRTSGLTQQTAQVKLDYAASPALDLAAGVSADQYVSAGRAQDPGENSAAVGYRLEDPRLRAVAGFAQLAWRPSGKWELEAGFRASLYKSNQPAGLRRSYAGLPGTGVPVQLEVLTAPREIDLGTVLQPRASLNYRLGARSTVGLAYTRLAQPIHQLSATVSPTPADIYFVATDNIPVTTTHAYSLQFSRPAQKGVHPVGVELGSYLRTSDNLLQTRNGRTLRESPSPETAISRGTGLAYGAEVALTLAGLRNSLTVGYAYGRSLVDVDRRYAEQRFTTQRRLPTNTDLPHQLNLNYLASFSTRSSFTASYTFTSGRAFTPTDGYLFSESGYVPTFGSLQEGRLAPTHRVDLGFTVDNSDNARRGLRVGFGIGIYNLLMRENPFLAYYRPNRAGRLSAYQFSLIGKAIPSLNINFQWD